MKCRIKWVITVWPTTQETLSVPGIIGAIVRVGPLFPFCRLFMQCFHKPLVQRSRDLFLPSDSLRHLSHQLLTLEVGSNGAVLFSWLQTCFCLRQFASRKYTLLQKNTKIMCFSYFYLFFAKLSCVYNTNFVYLLKTHLKNVFKTHTFYEYFMYKCLLLGVNTL